MNVEAQNAVQREKRRIRDEVLKLYSLGNPIGNKPRLMISREQVLAIVDGDTAENAKIKYL